MTREQRLAARRGAYSLAAGAATAVAATESQAQIVWSGPQDIAIEQFNSLLLDIDQDSRYLPSDDVTLKNYVFGGGNYQGLVVNFYGGRAIGFQGSFPYASALAPGVLIDSDSTESGVTSGSLAYGANNPSAEFNTADAAYIGVRFPINTFQHFGWIRVTIDNDSGTFIVHDWAYNSSTTDELDEFGNPIFDGFGDRRQIGLPILTGQVAGDYNRDGVVDAADYTVYRNTLGSEDILDADGDADGIITAFGDPGVEDDGDLFVWRQDYGFSALQPSVPSAASAAVPEPMTLGLLAAGALGVAAMRSARNRREGRAE